MPLKLFIAGVFQETNEFSPIPTSLASFHNQFWRPRDSATPPPHVNLLGYGEVLQRGRELGLDVVPSLFASCVPSAPLSRADWEKLKGEVLDDLKAALPVDIVFLFLHGAQGAQGLPDADGDIIEAVREIAGREAKIGVEFDLHGNLTERKLKNADVIIACKEYPHIDFPEEGAKALDLLIRAARGEVRPVMKAARVPLMTVGPTTIEPMKSFVADVRKLETQPGVLTASVLHGFFATDHTDVGASTIVVTDGDAARAGALAIDLGRRFANVARQMGSLGVDIAGALDRAERAKGCVVIADRADNAGGGAGSDATFILEEMLKRGMRDATLGMIWDPIAVEFCHSAGEGADLTLRIGGKVGPMSGRPLDVHARVLAVRDGICQQWFGRGEPNLPIGRSAAIRVDDIDIVLNSNRHQVFSRHAFDGHGIDLASKKTIVVKSTQHFYGAFAPLGEVVYCDAPGTVAMDFTTIPYKHIRRPIYPLDREFEIEPTLFP